jgi:hypothetical protein
MPPIELLSADTFSKLEGGTYENIPLCVECAHTAGPERPLNGFILMWSILAAGPCLSFIAGLSPSHALC